MEYLYPAESIKEFTLIEKRLNSKAAFGADMDKIVEKYMSLETDGLSDAFCRCLFDGEKILKGE